MDRSWTLLKRVPGQKQPGKRQSLLGAPWALEETQHLVLPQEQPLLGALLSGDEGYLYVWITTRRWGCNALQVSFQGQLTWERLSGEVPRRWRQEPCDWYDAAGEDDLNGGLCGPRSQENKFRSTDLHIPREAENARFHNRKGRTWSMKTWDDEDMTSFDEATGKESTDFRTVTQKAASFQV